MTLLLALLLTSTGQAKTAQLGALSSRLPLRDWVLLAPSLSAAAQRLGPLLERLGAAFPDLHPQRIFLDQRVRLGFDLMDSQSLMQVGIDPTGPLYLFDDGRMLQPLYVVRLAPGGRELFAQVPQRVQQREALALPKQVQRRGLTALSWAVAADADPRFAYLVDGDLLVFAPQGCDRSLHPLFDLLRSKKRGRAQTLDKSALARLPAGAVYMHASAAALKRIPLAQLRRGAKNVRDLDLVYDLVNGEAQFEAAIHPSPQGQAQLSGLRELGKVILRPHGALSLWWMASGQDWIDRAQRPAYLKALRGWYAAAGVDLGHELGRWGQGLVSFHLLDLEPQLPGLNEMTAVPLRDQAFFVPQAWRFRLKDAAAAKAFVAKTKDLLRPRVGVLSEDAGPCRYAGGGRVTDFAVIDDADLGAMLQVSTGPNSPALLAADQGQTVLRPTAGSLLAMRADAMALRGALGRISLLSAGQNNDLRALWAMSQLLSPALRGFGEISAELGRQPGGLRMQVTAVLRQGASQDGYGGGWSNPRAIESLKQGLRP